MFRTQLDSRYDRVIDQIKSIMIVNPTQDAILAHAHTDTDYLHIPYWASKPMNGFSGHLSCHMLPMALMCDWQRLQGVITDASNKEDEIIMTICDKVVNDKLEELSSGAAASNNDLTWEARESWYDQEDDHKNPAGKQRNGLEPKVIGLLVNIYRYASESKGHLLWHRTIESASRIYAAHPNIRM